MKVEDKKQPIIPSQSKVVYNSIETMNYDSKVGKEFYDLCAETPEMADSDGTKPLWVVRKHGSTPHCPTNQRQKDDKKAKEI